MTDDFIVEPGQLRQFQDGDYAVLLDRFQSRDWYWHVLLKTGISVIGEWDLLDKLNLLWRKSDLRL